MILQEHLQDTLQITLQSLLQNNLQNTPQRKPQQVYNIRCVSSTTSLTLILQPFINLRLLP